MSIQDLFSDTGFWDKFKNATEPVKNPACKFEFGGVVVYDAYAGASDSPTATNVVPPDVCKDLQAAADYGEC